MSDADAKTRPKRRKRTTESASTSRRSKGRDPDAAEVAEALLEGLLEDESRIDGLAEFFYSDDEATVSSAGLVTVDDADLDDEVAEEEAQAGEYLSFLIGGEEYAVPIAALREIVRPIPVTEVPRTPSYVLGVVTLRGTVLPVFDLRVRLGLPVAPELPRTGRILVLDTDDGPAGVVAEKVSEVVRIGLVPLEPPPPALGGGAEYLEGIIRREGRMLIVLNLDTALGVELGGRSGREGA